MINNVTLSGKSTQYNHRPLQVTKDSTVYDINVPQEEFIPSCTIQKPYAPLITYEKKLNKNIEDSNVCKLDESLQKSLQLKYDKSINIFSTALAHVARVKMFKLAASRINTVMATGRWVTLAGDNNINIATSGVKHFTKKEIEDMYKRFSHLASDPAKGNKISPGSIEEAVIAFAAEKGNIIPHRVEREKTGLSEFIDARGITWDVKSPVSPTFSGAWTFDPHHQLMKIRHDLSQGDRTLLNLTRCNAKDTKTLLNLLKDELEPEERSLIYILLNKEAIEL